MPTYKLTYFNAKALGEPIRYMLSYMGTEFEDIRLAIKPAPNLRDMPQVPFGRIPILEIDGRVLHQSAAIMRYLAVDAGLAAANVEERLQINMIVGAFGDLQDEVARYYKTENFEEKEKIKKELNNDIIPFFMERFEKALEENNGYFANGKLTWADLYIVAYSESFPGFLEIDLFEKYKLFRDLRDKLHSIPGIKEWVEKRPKTLL